jgi:1,4-dihydroxy-6-naphthoate synthase
MTVKLRELSIAHSPDTDDAFMYFGLAQNKVDTKGVAVKQVMKDIQSLNVEAVNGTYEVSAISFAAYPRVRHLYKLLSCGSSMGENYGPMIVAKKPLSIEELKEITVAIPGLETSAYLTMQLWQPGLKVVAMHFDKILEAVVAGEVDAGLIIHEGQLTYKDAGLIQIVDLGVWWHQETGLPLPLGGNAVRKDLGDEMMQEALRIFRTSVVYALEHREEALNYALSFARDMDPKMADRFVSMYVNELTVDLGERGKEAVRLFYQKAYDKGILKELVVPEFV